MERLPADHFDVVVIDEFHHASAPTYQRLLSHLRPVELLGLTATPERGDGKDVRSPFEGRTAYELRLWDALAADLLVPFHYFGVADDVDLTGIEWKRGAYDVKALDRVYTGNDARAAKVLRELRDKVTDVRRMRALGFCVSVTHAESGTIFLQQLGRGLRRSYGKPVLTVLDLIGQHRREFRFDVRYRALSGSSRKALEHQIEHGFPYLPSGSQLVLDRVSQGIVLDNVRRQLQLTRKDLVTDVRSHGDLPLGRYLEDAGRDLADVYTSGGARGVSSRFRGGGVHCFRVAAEACCNRLLVVESVMPFVGQRLEQVGRARWTRWPRRCGPGPASCRRAGESGSSKLRGNDTIL